MDYLPFYPRPPCEVKVPKGVRSKKGTETHAKITPTTRLPMRKITAVDHLPLYIHFIPFVSVFSSRDRKLMSLYILGVVEV